MEAVRWLDRALRLAPLDQNITLSLATVLLGRDTPRAAALFEQVAVSAGVREAWQGLAAARNLLGDHHGAASCLARALSQATVTATANGLADDIVRRAGAAGWCGITTDGRLALYTVEPGTVVLSLDGRPLRGRSLPRTWTRARRLDVILDRQPLLGSPIDIAAINRVIGCVEADAGNLRGWAWQPGSPDADPVLVVRPATGGSGFSFVANTEATGIEHAGPLARPRHILVPATRLAASPGLWHVTTADGRDLLGSPLDPMAEQRAGASGASVLARLYPAGPGTTRPRRGAGLKGVPPFALPITTPPPAPSTPNRRRPVDVVIPVYENASLVLACLDSVLADLPRGSHAIVVDDASQDPALIETLDTLAARKRIRLIRNTRNRGFPASANIGIAACPGRDVVLLNSDTLVPPGWLDRLKDAANGHTGIGTATPLSNDASILSYPDVLGGNLIPDQSATNRLGALAWQANSGTVVDIPVGVGFCLYIRRDCLDSVGLFRTDVFAQGYGEENDFCLRARHLGWRHVAVPGVYVAHRSGASFGGPGVHLRLRNARLLNRLHPGHDELIADFARTDPLAEARRCIDLLRFRAPRPRGAAAVLLVTHADGGGVERRIGQSCETHRAAGRRPIVLRPLRTADDRAAVGIGDGPGNDFPNLCYRMPDELPALRRLLRSAHITSVEVHHFLNHDPAIYRLLTQLGLPYDVHVHDYAWFCPRISLVDANRRYCGEPPVSVCEYCVADAGRLIQDDIPVADLIARAADFLQSARQVIAPSFDAADRMRRHFPALRPMVVPHEDDSALPDPEPPMPHDGRCRVCVLGSIGTHKGYDVLLACARDAAARGLALDFVVVGSTTDDTRLLATRRVFITGSFHPQEAVGLVRAQRASLGLLPSIWPETWSLGLSDLWRAGLTVAAFDIGAPAERISRGGRGFLLPPGSPAWAVNNALVAAVGLSDNKQYQKAK